MCGRQGKNSGKLRKGRKASQGAEEEKSLAGKERKTSQGERKALQRRREKLHRGKERPCREASQGPNTLFPSLLVLEKVLLSLDMRVTQ